MGYFGYFFAVFFVALGAIAVIAYGGTPHGGPTSTCQPIEFFGNTYTIAADCRYLSSAEIIVAIMFFLLAVFAALTARPRR